jgi:hypothetical protein
MKFRSRGEAMVRIYLSILYKKGKEEREGGMVGRSRLESLT